MLTKVQEQNLGIKVSEEDKDKIQDAMDKIHALENLILVTENNPLIYNEKLYQRFLQDVIVARKEYDKVWDNVATKYHILQRKETNLHIDFETCIVTIVEATS